MKFAMMYSSALSCPVFSSLRPCISFVHVTSMRSESVLDISAGLVCVVFVIKRSSAERKAGSL